MTAVFDYLATNPLIYLFLLVAIGMLLGHIKVRGVSLGAAAVLFSAIGFTAWAGELGVDIEIPPVVGTLGLVLFAFGIGVTSGSSFFHNLKTAVGPILMMVLLMAVAGATSLIVGTKVFGLSTAASAGTFAGALTNTPALHAAGEASGDLAGATVSYSIAYLFGVLGMLGATMAALSYGKHDKDAPSPIANRTIRVEREDHPFIGDLYEKMNGNVTFSRLRRGEEGPISRPAMSDTLDPGDLVTVVGPKEAVSRISNELGHGSSHSLMRDRSYLDFRRITVSDPKVAGHTVGSLGLAQKYSATVSRVRRGDVDMVGEHDLVLQLGDRVRVVAPTSKMKEITNFFGDSSRGLSDINPIALGIGLALGIALGLIHVPLPGGYSFAIGAAAGTLIVGLAFGKVGRIGPFVTAIPYTASQVLIEFGLLVFLAQAGSVAGSQIMEAFRSGMWVSIFLLGVLVTSVMAVGMYVTFRWMFKMGGTKLAGALGGAQTQPAVLAFANGRTHDDPRVALGYALVYPVAMVAKILIATILGVF
mgnify:FL=1